ncbi:MAG: DNA-formamidopyrimidine glycosylase family protein [Candidatus Thorarchaeota archaeon]|jgi:formamidopyrimidine-DNA glycosylase
MPEGPECHYAARRLEKTLKGKHIVKFEIRGGRYKTHGPFQGYDYIVEHIESGNHTVKAVGCRGKLIVMFFDNNWCMLSTLGLKGSWTTRCSKHCDIALVASENTKLWFKDQMHYGTLKYVALRNAEKKILSLGPDVTIKDPAFTHEYLCALIKKHTNWDLAKLLMDQSKISGIGNYLKAEILYKARLSPRLLCKDVGSEETVELYDAIIDIPSQFFQKHLGNSSIYRHVYGRSKDRLGNKVETCKTNDGRTSHWVPALQLTEPKHL